MTHIRDMFGSGPTLSFEFFPPKTEPGMKNLNKTLTKLAKAQPDFVSVTYGAMGSTRDTTQQIVTDICAAQPFPAMAHLTCVGHSREELIQLLDEYAEAGVDNILALSGDPVESPQSSKGSQDSLHGLEQDLEHNSEQGSQHSSVQGLQYSSEHGPQQEQEGEYSYALQLVELVKSHPHDFTVGVAAHPEIHPRSKDRKSDRQHLAEKLELADFAITQFFFYPEYYFRLMEELGELGVTKPVIPGVIPVVNTESILRFSEVNKVRVDQDLIQRLNATDNPKARLEIATDAALKMCQELLTAGAPGIHLYTLNQAPAPLTLAEYL